MIKKIEVERFSLTSSKPFDEVLAAINDAIGHPGMSESWRSTHEARSFAELRSAIEKGLSKAGLMLFMQLDQGAVVRKEMSRDVPRIIRLLIKRESRRRISHVSENLRSNRQDRWPAQPAPDCNR